MYPPPHPECLPNEIEGALVTLQGEVHDARVQRVHLRVRVAVHAVKVVGRLAVLLGERTVREVGHRVEGGRLGRGGGHGSQPGLGLQLGLQRVVLVHGQTGQGQRDDGRGLDLAGGGQREAGGAAGQSAQAGIQGLPSAALGSVRDQLVQLVCGRSTGRLTCDVLDFGDALNVLLR